MYQPYTGVDLELDCRRQGITIASPERLQFQALAVGDSRNLIEFSHDSHAARETAKSANALSRETTSDDGVPRPNWPGVRG